MAGVCCYGRSMNPTIDPSAVAPDLTGTPENASAMPSMAAAAPSPITLTPIPEQRPTVPQRVRASVERWWGETTNLPQRQNALYEYREANKTLFPSRFNRNDPRRGQQTHESRTKEDSRRVQTPYIYRDSLQSTALIVPDDIEFCWSSSPQVEPIQTPQIDPLTGVTGAPPPTMATLDPMRGQFAKTLDIVQTHLMQEAHWVAKTQAAVQDSSTFPIAAIKFSFRRDFATTTLNPTPGNKDSGEMMTRLKGLMQSFAAKQFTKDAPEAEQMFSLIRSLHHQASVTQWFGIDYQLVPGNAIGISEDALDSVNILDAAWIFHDVLLTGDDILARYPYREMDAEEAANEIDLTDNESTKVTLGVLPTDLATMTPWAGDDTITDPDAGPGSTRGRGRTSRKSNRTTINQLTGKNTVDPRKSRYLVREIWSKTEKRVIVLIQGLGHVVDTWVPLVTGEDWYPFWLIAPNRVPTELYGISDLELKRDIQARIHNKRTDEEKARELSLPRGIYNTAGGVDQNEMLKMRDIPAGQLRGINFGTTQTRIDDMVQWWKYEFRPECFDTGKDERDKDIMGALPVQMSGATGVANYAAEVQMAGAGASLATKFRQDLIRRGMERMLKNIAQILIQELSPKEARDIAGPFAVWPEIHTDDASRQIVDEATQRISSDMGPVIFQQVLTEIQASGRPMEPHEIQKLIDQSTAPLISAEMLKRFGAVIPVSRESLFRHMGVAVRSSFTNSLDQQSNLQMISMLGTSLVSLGTACMNAGVAFDPRPVIKRFAPLIGDIDEVDGMFPATPPIQQAAAMQQASVDAQPQPGDPTAQGARGQESDAVGGKSANGAKGGAPTAAGPMPGK